MARETRPFSFSDLRVDEQMEHMTESALNSTPRDSWQSMREGLRVEIAQEVIAVLKAMRKDICEEVKEEIRSDIATETKILTSLTETQMNIRRDIDELQLLMGKMDGKGLVKTSKCSTAPSAVAGSADTSPRYQLEPASPQNDSEPAGNDAKLKVYLGCSKAVDIAKADELQATAITSHDLAGIGLDLAGHDSLGSADTSPLQAAPTAAAPDADAMWWKQTRSSIEEVQNKLAAQRAELSKRMQSVERQASVSANTTKPAPQADVKQLLDTCRDLKEQLVADMRVSIDNLSEQLKFVCPKCIITHDDHRHLLMDCIQQQEDLRKQVEQVLHDNRERSKRELLKEDEIFFSKLEREPFCQHYLPIDTIEAV